MSRLSLSSAVLARRSVVQVAAVLCSTSRQATRRSAVSTSCRLELDDFGLA